MCNWTGPCGMCSLHTVKFISYNIIFCICVCDFYVRGESTHVGVDDHNNICYIPDKPIITRYAILHDDGRPTGRGGQSGRWNNNRNTIKSIPSVHSAAAASCCALLGIFFLCFPLLPPSHWIVPFRRLCTYNILLFRL